MKHAVPHDLGQEQATKVARAALQSYAERFADYNPVANWVSDRKANIGFSAKGLSLKGSLEVTSSTIDMDLDVPFLLRPFKGRAVGIIEEEIRRWIGKAKAGEL